jgi:glutathione synthase/RimK-type ligase-like ATP-grasp enzyme
MNRQPRLVRHVTEFRQHYAELRAGDAVVGPLPLHHGEGFKWLDLADRGVALFPPALAQLLNGSKAAQAEILGEFLVPGTFVAYRLADLTDHLAAFHELYPGAVVSKRDRAHLGLGVGLWPSLEVLYSLAGLQSIAYPLVVQPLVPGARDFRVVVLGDYAEAYERVNPHGFRKNLFQGGSSRPAAAEPSRLDFCRRVMARGKFPYAILDLLVGPAGETYLSEINLQAGLTGARLSQAEYRHKVAALAQEFCRAWENSAKNPP